MTPPDDLWRCAVYWLPEAGDCVAVAADMGIDPAAPMTRQQHSEFTQRMDERILRRFQTRGE